MNADKLRALADRVLYTKTPRHFPYMKLAMLISKAIKEETGEVVEADRIADRTLQRARKRGHATFVRDGAGTVWFLTELGKSHAAGYTA